MDPQSFYRRESDGRGVSQGPGTSGPAADKPLAIVLGTTWCPDTARTLRFLQQLGVPYLFVDIDLDREAEGTVLRLNHGMRSVPTVVLRDGTFLTEPSPADLARRLGALAG